VTVEGHRTLLCAEGGEVVIGRQIPSAGLQLDHPAVSRVHVRLVPGPQWQIFDYESRNGTYINGHQVYEATLTDGMSVHFGAPHGPIATFRYAIDDRDKMRRLGRAVFQRSADMGISQRHLRLQANINHSMADNVLSGHCWPDRATCEAIDKVLSWPTGSLVAIAEGADPHDITDVITPELRHNLLVDSAALRLQSIASGLNDLPATTDPDFAVQVAELRRRIDDLDAFLSRESTAAESENTQALRCIANIYRRRLPGEAPQRREAGCEITGPTATGAPLRSARHET
jgi:hypothetical protein